MKKVLLSLLTIIYMAMSSGMAMEIHYCMGERVDAAISKKAGGKCGKCGMKEKKGGCCSEEHKLIKLSEEHKVSFNDHTFAPQPAMENIFTITRLWTIAPKGFNYIRIAAPADTGPPLYIYNRVFRV